jgi:hypothetical protein
MSPNDIEALRHLETLLAALARKAKTRFEGDPAAVELIELVGKAEAVVADLVKIHS